MNENKLEEDAILINDTDSEVLLGNFHVEEDPELLPEEEVEEAIDVIEVPEFLEVSVHDSVMGTAVGPGQL